MHSIPFFRNKAGHTAPKSHLEAGRLLLTLSDRKDPVAAIYHFRRFLLLQPNARESDMVEQLIVTAEREIIRKLPGEPYENYLESINLKMKMIVYTEIADLKALLDLLALQFLFLKSCPKTLQLIGNLKKNYQATIPSSYVVQLGVTVYMR